MSLAFDISKAGITCRLAGRREDRAQLDRRLRSMLLEEVLPRVAARLDAQLPAESVLCLPDIALHCRMTLQEVLTGAGSARWADLLTERLLARLKTGEALWQFENRWAYLAAYLRWRLDLYAAPEAVFAEIGPLALVTPRQVWAQALRTWPEIWTWLLPSPDPREAEALMRALSAQGGPVVFAEIMAAALQPPFSEGVPSGPEAMRAALERLVDTDLRPALSAWARLRVTGPEAAFLLASRVAPDLGPLAPRAGLILSLILSDGSTPATSERRLTLVFRSLRDRLSDWPAALRPVLAGLMAALGRSVQGRADMSRLLHQLAALDARPPDQQRARAVDASQHRTSDLRPARGAQDTDARVFVSPLAGLGLVLPFLAENRIARAHSASARLAAFVALAADGPLAQPENDPCLLALAGTDPDGVPPTPTDRPVDIDLLFLPEDRRVIIAETPPGPARLALWLEARFALSLPGLSGSSRQFLAAHFLHRPGRLILANARATLELPAPPLAAVLHLSGLIGPALCRLDWMQGETLDIRLGDGP